MECPDFETLLAALEDPSAATEVARHLDSGCRSCAERMRLLRDLMSTDRNGFPECSMRSVSDRVVVSAPTNASDPLWRARR